MYRQILYTIIYVYEYLCAFMYVIYIYVYIYLYIFIHEIFYRVGIYRLNIICIWCFFMIKRIIMLREPARKKKYIAAKLSLENYRLPVDLSFRRLSIKILADIHDRYFIKICMSICSSLRTKNLLCIFT